MEGEIKRAVKGRCVIGSITMERKEYAYGGKERFKEQYSSANIDMD